MKNTKGFGLYGLLAVVVVAAVVGVAVWRITASKENKEPAATTTKQETQQTVASEPVAEAPVDPTADWQSYTDPTYKYTVKYPKNWVRNTNTESCSAGLMMLASSSEGLGRCATENGGRVVVVAADTATEDGYRLSSYKDVVVTDVFASGVTGKKYTVTVKNGEEMEVGGPVVGSMLVNYVYNKNGRMYAVMYTETPGQSNDREIVDKIATFGFLF